ncbi:glycoside hydrolase family 16 protein [Peniophora sp. CONT]|nr:glycoside hydrolase family 16 protein [Peniophora sp. CONT]
MKLTSRFSATLALARLALAGTFSVVDSYEGQDFINEWTFEAIPDPTHGYVNYVDKSTAVSKGLVFASGSNFTLKADDTTVVSSSASGRDSVRIQSPKTYNSHVTVINLAHMPKACGSWPAVWEVGPNWPQGGEVDIIEGVNDQGTNALPLVLDVVFLIAYPTEPNRSSLHTSPDCTIPSTGDFSGTVVSTNCDTSVNDNSGCGFDYSTDNSYGHSFNLIQGGFYASERTSTEVKIWFWPRTATNIPSDVKSGSSTINTNNWGRPQAYFPNTNCDIGSHFNDNNIVINLTFCGDWAGSAYSSSGCPGTCNDYVKNNPSEMVNAYFLIMWLKVYESSSLQFDAEGQTVMQVKA